MSGFDNIGGIDEKAWRDSGRQRLQNGVGPASLNAANVENPLAELALQLARLDETQRRLRAIADRLLGERPPEATREGEAISVYGGVIGALETEGRTLRRGLNAMHDDMARIERVLS